MAGELGHVVIEHPDPWVVGDEAAALRAAGFSVRLCAGPVFRSGGECPIITQGRCRYTDAADVIVHHLDPHNPVEGPVERALRRTYPGTPIVSGIAPHESDTLVDAVVGAASYLQRSAVRHRR